MAALGTKGGSTSKMSPASLGVDLSDIGKPNLRKEQCDYYSEITLDGVLDQLKQFTGSPLDQHVRTQTLCEYADPLESYDTYSSWHATIQNNINLYQCGFARTGCPAGQPVPSNAVESRIGELEKQIKSDCASSEPVNAECEQLRTRQKELNAALNNRMVEFPDDVDAKTRLDQLKEHLDRLHAVRSQGGDPTVLRCLSGSQLEGTPAKVKPALVHQQTWAIHSVNQLAPVLKQVSTYPYVASAPAFSALGETSTPVELTTVTLIFQPIPRFEFFTGLMVPTTPFHGYAKASVATNGAVTGNVVQETRTYTVIPMESVNVRLGSGWIINRQPAALFGSFGVGYNPATSAVNLAVGPSFSWRSVVVSGLAAIGSDTHLAGGFKVGQQLGLADAATPLTANRWGVKPGIALSVRLPLGGAGSK